MYKIIALNNGLKVKVWSDNENCTLHVFDACQDFDDYSTYLTVINYSEVAPEYLKNLCFYQSKQTI